MPTVDLAQTLAAAFGHLDAGRMSEAWRLARRLEHLRREVPGVDYLVGLLHLADGDGRKAAQFLVRALAQTPDAPPVLLGLARSQLQQKRLTVAQRLFRRLLRLAPAMAEAWRGYGEALLQAGDALAAVEILQWACRLQPDAAEALNLLGVAQRDLGHLDRAALSFAEAIDAEPDFSPAVANLAALLRRLKRPNESLALAERAVALDPAGADHWLELGMIKRDAADLDGAGRAFAEACRLAPDRPEAAWLEAENLAARGEPQAAQAAYRRVLLLDPDDGFGASLALAQLGAAPTPDRAPEAFVRGLFDQYAESFDHDLVDGLHYRAPDLLWDAVTRGLGRGPFEIFDAGCGTGLAGRAFLSVAKRLEGADLSPAMLEKARQRGIYDALVEGDLARVLAARRDCFDLVVAADVLIYLGDLAPVFLAVARALRPGGGFAFTVEEDDGTRYRLLPSRRYAHGESYLRECAAAAGLTVRLVEKHPLRHDQGRPVPGLVAVFAKPSS